MDRDTKARLEKIQALMENAGTVGEAEAAAQAFQRLVMRHNLSAEELAGLGQAEREAYMVKMVVLGGFNERGITWKRSLLTVIARFNFCDTIRYGTTGAMMAVIGQRTNIDAVETMYHTMVSTFTRLSHETWAARKHELPFSKPRAWKFSFLMGVPSGLMDKFTAERESEVAADSNVSALVEVKGAELEDFLANEFPNVVNRMTTYGVSDGSGYRAGYKAGREYQDMGSLDDGPLALGSGRR